MRDLRKLATGLVIVSFSIAALMGIVAILGGGEFGETEAQVLWTTVIVGLWSVTALCYLALAGHRYALVGVLGAAASTAAAGFALWTTWFDLDGFELWKWQAVSSILAASLAQASLLLAFVGRRAIRATLGVTLLAVAVVAVMATIPILNEDVMTEGYWKTFGVVAILDVLGTVVLMALEVRRGRSPEPVEEGLLTAQVQARLIEAARGRDVSPSRLVSDALDAFLAPR